MWTHFFQQLPDRVELLLEAILPLCWKGQWLTVEEMTELTKLHPATVRWCMRQLRTGKEGEFVIRKRRRAGAPLGPYEFYVKRKPAQMRIPFEVEG